MVKFLDAVKRGLNATLIPVSADHPRDSEGKVYAVYLT